MAEIGYRFSNFLAQIPLADNGRPVGVRLGGTGFQPVLHRQDAGATRRIFSSAPF